MASALLGFAHKQGQNRRSWKRRFFVVSPLSSTASMLSYFSSEAEARVGAPTSRKGCLVVGKGTKVLEEHECRVNWPSGTFVSGSGFGVRTQHRTLYLHCKNAVVAKEWKNILRDRIQQHQDVVADKGRRATQLSTSQLSEFSDEGEDDAPRDTRLNTVVFKRKGHGDLAALCKQLSVRNAALNDETYELERQLQRVEYENNCLHRFSAYLRTVLLQHGVDLATLLPFDAFVSDPDLQRAGVAGIADEEEEEEEQWGFDDDDDEEEQEQQQGKGQAAMQQQAAQGADSGGSSKEVKRRAKAKAEQEHLREWAAVVIQRWYRQCTVNRYFSKVKASANERGRRRTLDRQRLKAKMHPRHGDIHARPRLPTTSLASRELQQRAVGSNNGSPLPRPASIVGVADGSGAGMVHGVAKTSTLPAKVGGGMTTAMLRRSSRAGSVARRSTGASAYSGGRRLTTSVRPLPKQEERREEEQRAAGEDHAQQKQRQQQVARQQEAQEKGQEEGKGAHSSKGKQATPQRVTSFPATAAAATAKQEKQGKQEEEMSAATKSRVSVGEISFAPPQGVDMGPGAGPKQQQVPEGVIDGDEEYFSIEASTEGTSSAATETAVTTSSSGTTTSTAMAGSKSLLAEDEEPAAVMPQTDVELARLAMYRFNKNPTKGMHDLMQCGLVVDDPQVIMRFLCEEPGISRAKLGEFLGSDDERSKACLKSYAKTFDFTDAAIDVCLRLFLLAFRIPGEAQKIERVMAAFANRYHTCNPSCFCHEDTAFILAFSIMMLHTDLHNPSNVRKMTLDEFVRNNRGIDDGGDVPRNVLEGIYHRIQAEEFQCCVDHTSKVETLEQRLGGHVPAGIVTETRQFVRTADVNELYRSKKDKAKNAAVKRVVTLVLFNDLLLVASQARAGRRYNIRKVFDLFTSELQREHEQREGIETFVLRSKDSGSSIRFHTDDPSVISAVRASLQLCRHANTFTWADSNC